MSVIGELVEPSLEDSKVWVVIAALAAGAVLFSAADYRIDEKLQSDEGVGVLAAAALMGNLALADANVHVLAAIRCVAAGAVVASLATEVFPKAFKDDRDLAGVATAIGLIIAIVLESLSG